MDCSPVLMPQPSLVDARPVEGSRRRACAKRLNDPWDPMTLGTFTGRGAEEPDAAQSFLQNLDPVAAVRLGLVHCLIGTLEAHVHGIAGKHPGRADRYRDRAAG